MGQALRSTCCEHATLTFFKNLSGTTIQNYPSSLLKVNLQHIIWDSLVGTISCFFLDVFDLFCVGFSTWEETLTSSFAIIYVIPKWICNFLYSLAIGTVLHTTPRVRKEERISSISSCVIQILLSSQRRDQY